MPVQHGGQMMTVMVQSNLQSEMLFVVLYGLSVIKAFSYALPGNNLTAANTERSIL